MAADGVIRFPAEGESDEPLRDRTVHLSAPVDSRDLEQERDLRELETAERRKIAKAAIQQMLDTFDEWYK
jgi:hypothetical protein